VAAWPSLQHGFPLLEPPGLRPDRDTTGPPAVSAIGDTLAGVAPANRPFWWTKTPAAQDFSASRPLTRTQLCCRPSPAPGGSKLSPPFFSRVRGGAPTCVPSQPCRGRWAAGPAAPSAFLLPDDHGLHVWRDGPLSSLKPRGVSPSRRWGPSRFSVRTLPPLSDTSPRARHQQSLCASERI
jgi:hypothetical protein